MWLGARGVHQLWTHDKPGPVWQPLMSANAVGAGRDFGGQREAIDTDVEATASRCRSHVLGVSVLY